jgi:hypothetical protein
VWTMAHERHEAMSNQRTRGVQGVAHFEKSILGGLNACRLETIWCIRLPTARSGRTGVHTPHRSRRSRQHVSFGSDLQRLDPRITYGLRAIGYTEYRIRVDRSIIVPPVRGRCPAAVTG